MKSPPSRIVCRNAGSAVIVEIRHESGGLWTGSSCSSNMVDD